MSTTDHPSPETLHGYVDGALAGAEATTVAAHLAACSACQEEVATLNTLAAALATVGDVSLDRDLSGAVLSRLAAEGAWDSAGARRWLTVLWSLQGVIAAGLLILLWPAIVAWWTAVTTSGAASAVAWQESVGTTVAGWLAAVTALTTAWPAPLALPEIPPDQLLLLLGLIVAAWIAGNGVLLRPSGDRQRLNGGSHG